MGEDEGAGLVFTLYRLTRALAVVNVLIKEKKPIGSYTR